MKKGRGGRRGWPDMSATKYGKIPIAKGLVTSIGTASSPTPRPSLPTTKVSYIIFAC